MCNELAWLVADPRHEGPPSNLHLSYLTWLLSTDAVLRETTNEYTAQLEDWTINCKDSDNVAVLIDHDRYCMRGGKHGERREEHDRSPG
jgi:hypothetical protein